MQDNFIICLLYQKHTDSYIHFPKSSIRSLLVILSLNIDITIHEDFFYSFKV